MYLVQYIIILNCNININLITITIIAIIITIACFKLLNHIKILKSHKSMYMLRQ